MTEPLWVAAGYAVGAVPSAALVARARGAPVVLGRARRDEGERDAHLVLQAHLGGRWAATAATADVLKGLAVALAARLWGGLPHRWLAAVGIAVVVGYCWPPVERAMAGRGLAASAGVYLALLPIPVVVMGAMILVGAALGDTAAASTIGLAVVPVVAAAGVPWPRPVLYRAVFDSSGPRDARVIPEERALPGAEGR